jgi:hypothetical protein
MRAGGARSQLPAGEHARHHAPDPLRHAGNMVSAPCAPEARAPSARLGSTPVITPLTRSGTLAMQYSSYG